MLGIETSCDETAVAILSPEGEILAERLRSQPEQAPFGGVVPEVAARAHLAHLPGMVADALAAAGLRPADLGAVAATAGPGLIGGLIVGSTMARGLALALDVPFVGVNHLEAHALTPRLPGLDPDGAPFPYLLLLVSGGHCQCVLVRGVGDHVRLGGTLDDAAGEAFDKAAKLLGLGWPGGPALERLAASGEPGRVTLPRPLLGRPGCDFSFSGLKTAVALIAGRYPPGAPIPIGAAADIAAEFQRAVADILADRTAHALRMARDMADVSLVVVAGGVAANTAIRRALATIADRHGARLLAPPLRLCTDNAVMVAWAGIERLRLGLADPLDQPPRPRWPLEALRQG